MGRKDRKRNSSGRHKQRTKNNRNSFKKYKTSKGGVEKSKRKFPIRKESYSPNNLKRQYKITESCIDIAQKRKAENIEQVHVSNIYNSHDPRSVYEQLKDKIMVNSNKNYDKLLNEELGVAKNSHNAVDTDDSEEDSDSSNETISEDEDNTKELTDGDSEVPKCELSDDDLPTDNDVDGFKVEDPFDKHFNFCLDELLVEAVQKEPQLVKMCNIDWPLLGQLVISIPTPKEKIIDVPTPKFFLVEKQEYAEHGKIPERLNQVNFSQLHIKSQLWNNISSANAKNINQACKNPSPFSSFQRELFSIINAYQDLYYPERSFDNAEHIRFVYCLHTVNHILKTRLRIIHHNAKISNKKEITDEYCDQGLVRPKVLILLPFRDSALRTVKMITSILLPDEKANVINKTRFLNEYTGSKISMPIKNPKPPDYEALFTGNTDDNFKIGLSVTKKSLKLYADFYSADIIIASPLALRLTIGAEGEIDRDYDFLASIEILIMDQTEVFLMQNWDHVIHLMKHLHLQPKDLHGTDISRVRSWAADGQSKYYRQTLLFSSVMFPHLNALFTKRCSNYAGKVWVKNLPINGTATKIIVDFPQVFQRVEIPSIKSIDDRFNFFIKTVLPQYKETSKQGTLIYIPWYYDFVRIRNYFRKEDLSFTQISEYTKEQKIARARDMFFHNQVHFMLYTERCHFFRRFRLKGIQHIIFYEPPTFPNFYSEICNLLHESFQRSKDDNIPDSLWEKTSVVIYSRHDVVQLISLVGSEKCQKMISSDKNVHIMQ